MTHRLLVEAEYATDASALFPRAAHGFGAGLTVLRQDADEGILHAEGSGPVSSHRRTVLAKGSGAQWRDILMIDGRLQLWRHRLALRWMHRSAGGKRITSRIVRMED